MSKFVLSMRGGPKGLLVNNTHLCQAKPQATVDFDAQNGKTRDATPVVRDWQKRLREAESRPIVPIGTMTYRRLRSAA